MPTVKIYVVQTCRICGRTLQVPIALLGDTAVCPHCTASFLARDSSCGAPAASDPTTLLFQQRIDALLDGYQGGIWRRSAEAGARIL